MAAAQGERVTRSKGDAQAHDGALASAQALGARHGDQRAARGRGESHRGLAPGKAQHRHAPSLRMNRTV